MFAWIGWEIEPREFTDRSSGCGSAISTSTVAAFGGILDEFKEGFEFGSEDSIPLEDFSGVLDTDLGPIQKLVGFADGSDRTCGKVLSLQSHDIHAARPRRETFGQHVGRNILKDSREAADKAVATDRCEVVDSDPAAESRIMFDSNVTTEHDVVGSDHAVFDHAVVRDMGGSHKIALAADRGDPLVLFGSSIDGGAFPKNVAVADDDLRRGSLVGKVLRLSADDTAGKEAVIASDGGVADDGHTVFQACSTADPHVGTDHAMMSDSNVFIQFSSGVHHGGMSDDR
jgi:hypothetical protein